MEDAPPALQPSLVERRDLQANGGAYYDIRSYVSPDDPASLFLPLSHPTRAQIALVLLRRAPPLLATHPGNRVICLPSLLSPTTLYPANSPLVSTVFYRGREPTMRRAVERDEQALSHPPRPVPLLLPHPVLLRLPVPSSSDPHITERPRHPHACQTQYESCYWTFF
jgi:hypothetical protein